MGPVDPLYVFGVCEDSDGRFSDDDLRRICCLACGGSLVPGTQLVHLKTLKSLKAGSKDLAERGTVWW